MQEPILILETARTYLRTFCEEDLEELVRLHTDVHVMNYLIGGARTSRASVERDLAGYLRHQAEHQFGKWAIVHKESREFMGRAGFVCISEADEIDLGYTFHQKFWRQGYGTEVARALVEYGLSRWKKEKIVGLVVPGNLPSAKILEKVGFRFSGNEKYFGAQLNVYRL